MMEVVDGGDCPNCEETMPPNAPKCEKCNILLIWPASPQNTSQSSDECPKCGTPRQLTKKSKRPIRLCSCGHDFEEQGESDTHGGQNSMALGITNRVNPHQNT